MGLVDVEGRAGQRSGGQGLNQGVLLHHFVEGGVDEEGTRREGGQLFMAYHAGSFAGGGGVEGEEVRLLKQRL